MMQSEHNGVVVIGSSNTDLVVAVDHIPQPGETILGGDLVRAAGGKGANQAVAARRAGASVTFIACVGDDAFGESALQRFTQEGVDTTYIRRASGVPSGVALIAVAASGENSIVVAPGANSHLSPADCEQAQSAIVTARCVIAQLEVPVPAIERGFTLAREAGVTTILNPAPAQQLPSSLLRLVDILVCNESEATILSERTVTDRESATLAAPILQRLGLRTVIITLGSAGALAFDGPTRIDVPAYRVPVVDTTAAGDAFIGALAAWLARGESLSDSLRAASAAGALAVQHVGAQPSLPDYTAIISLM